jgi:hypothetical protein
MTEALALVGRMTGLPFLIGIKPYATLFGFGVLLTLGYITDPFFHHPSFHIFTNPLVLMLLGVLFLVDTFADKVPVIGHVNDLVNLVIKPLAAVLVSLLAVNAIDVEQNLGLGAIAFAVAGGAGVSFSAHLANMTARIGSTRTTRGLANPIVSGAGDMISLAGTWVLVRHPVLIGVAVIAFLVVFSYFAPRLFRTAKSIVTAPFALVRYWLGIGAPAPENVDRSPR